MAWKINFWARLLDGDRAYRMIHNLFTLVPADVRQVSQAGGLYANLFDAHPPFQIDGNFGFSAGVAEMLLQSHNHEIYLLPALPSHWQQGTVQGLRARGGFDVDLGWEDGQIQWATLTSNQGEQVRLRTGNAMAVYQDGHAVDVTIEGDGVTVFETTVGQRYQIKRKEGKSHE